jgi:hypothetical protein
MASNARTAESGYDISLSYSSADHGIVEEIARKPRGEGLRTFNHVSATVHSGAEFSLLSSLISAKRECTLSSLIESGDTNEKVPLLLGRYRGFGKKMPVLPILSRSLG